MCVLLDSFVGGVLLFLFLSVVQCFKGIQLCVDYNNIRVESQGNTAGKNYLHKVFDIFSDISMYGTLGL